VNYIAQALKNLSPDGRWTIYNDEVTSIEWLSTEISKPTDAEIEAEVARLQAEYDSQQYARDRAAEYPAIGDQLDALFHAGVFPAEMAAQIQAIKDKYPKG
jgi:hypothetical protein